MHGPWSEVSIRACVVNCGAGWEHVAALAERRRQRQREAQCPMQAAIEASMGGPERPANPRRRPQGRRSNVTDKISGGIGNAKVDVRFYTKRERSYHPVTGRSLLLWRGEPYLFVILVHFSLSFRRCLMSVSKYSRTIICTVVFEVVVPRMLAPASVGHGQSDSNH
eukprot:COSAG02_NODE_5653_length_4149_cov_3.358765_3_plen_166_part_00